MAKRYTKNNALVDVNKRYTLAEAFELLSQFESAKFDETVNVAFRLGIDTKQSDQQVRGATVLPNGVGKKTRILVFAKGDKAVEAQNAGADYVGADDLVTKINEGWMEFDKVIASPDMMPVVSRVAKVLGPRGLMPNPKTGTVTPNLINAIGEERKGKVEYRAEKAGIVHAPIGKKSFGKEKLNQNLVALAESIIRAKPATAKGAYIRSITIAPTMGPGIRVEPSQFSVGVG